MSRNRDRLRGKGVIINDAKKDLKNCEDMSQLHKVKKKYLSDTGIITKELTSIPKLHYSIRKAQGRIVLDLWKSFNKLYEDTAKRITNAE